MRLSKLSKVLSFLTMAVKATKVQGQEGEGSQCDLPGLCDGHVLAAVLAEDKGECIHFCRWTEVLGSLCLLFLLLQADPRLFVVLPGLQHPDLPGPGGLSSAG